MNDNFHSHQSKGTTLNTVTHVSDDVMVLQPHALYSGQAGHAFHTVALDFRPFCPVPSATR
jgi:hypothetical protein